MTVKPALASRDLGAQDESAIKLVPLADVWPPLDQEPAAASEPARLGYARPPAADPGPVLPRQFATFLVEGLAGVRPVRQLMPWMSKRGSVHLHRLMPLFNGGHQPKVLRVLTARPAPDVIEMTIVVVTGARTRAIAIRLEHAGQPRRWLCTDIETALSALASARSGPLSVLSCSPPRARDPCSSLVAVKLVPRFTAPQSRTGARALARRGPRPLGVPLSPGQGRALQLAG